MTSISTTPAPARTDVREAPGRGISAASVRKHGLVLAAGAASWAGAMFVYGANPDTDPGIAVTDLTGLAFQVGVFALLQVQIKTRAIGVSRGAIRALKTERVLLALAMVWSLIHGAVPAARDEGWLAALDLFWPLSMFGMFLISLKVAFAGRWRNPARLWAFVSETWFIFAVPTFAIFGQGAADIVGPTHLIFGYITLGAILALQPHLVEDRD